MAGKRFNTPSSFQVHRARPQPICSGTSSGRSTSYRNTNSLHLRLAIEGESSKRPDPPSLRATGRACHLRRVGRQANDQLTNAGAYHPVRCPPMHRGQRESPKRTGASRKMCMKAPRGCPRRPDTIPRHKSGKARIAVCVRIMQGTRPKNHGCL